MEVDIFSLVQTNHASLADSPIDPGKKGGSSYLSVDSEPSIGGLGEGNPPFVILRCLQRVLPLVEDPALLPGLVHILGAAEGDLEQQKHLVRFLHNPLMEFLQGYWQRESQYRNLEHMDWACGCTELWADLSFLASSWSTDGTDKEDGIRVQQRRQIASTLVTWMQEALQMTTDRSKWTHTISTVLGCYMHLSKDQQRPPSEEESKIVILALHRCQTYHVGMEQVFADTVEICGNPLRLLRIPAPSWQSP